MLITQEESSMTVSVHLPAWSCRSYLNLWQFCCGRDGHYFPWYPVCVYANVHLPLSSDFSVWVPLPSLPQFPKRAQELCDALSWRICVFFFHRLILVTQIRSPFPERKLLSSEFLWGEAVSLLFSSPDRQGKAEWQRSCEAGYDPLHRKEAALISKPKQPLDLLLS